MYRLRRFFSLFTVVVAVAGLLAACGGSTSPTATTAATKPAATTGAAPTTGAAAATAAPTTAAAQPTTAPAATTASGSAAAASPIASVAASAPAGTQVAATTAATGQTGGTLTGGFDVGPGGSPGQYYPPSMGAGYVWLEKYFSKLIMYDVGYTKMVGELAESWNVSADAKSFTFKLRPNVKWHDGQPFTSKDVKFSVELAKNPDSQNVYQPKYTDITEIATPDPLTAVITTNKANVGLLDAMTYVFMFPEHSLGAIAVKDLPKNPWWTTNPIGTGPFKWSKLVPDQYVELVANDSYWRGRPKLDKLINRYFKEPGSALIALRKGEIQFTYVTLDESELIKSDANLTVIKGPSQVINFFQFNLKDPRFTDVRVRQAFMYAIDRDAVVNQVFKGAAVTTPCAFDNPKYLPKDANAYKQDVNKAKQLLKDANWDSIKGQPIELLTYYNDQLSQDILVAIQQQLGNVGIQVKIKAVDVPTFNSFVNKENPEFTLYYAGAANGADPDVTSIYFLSTALPPSGSNRGPYNNPDVDKAYQAGRAEIDPNKRAEDYQNACKILNNDLPWAPMWVTTRFGAVSKSVQNFVYTPSAGSGKYYDQSELWALAK
jgi:peptide/nickel transport system substrate-binding protein